ncbi:hypothetical protein Tco_1329365, partial [Tanacetum coccineum]
MAPVSSPSPHNSFNLPPCNPYPSPYPHPYHAVVPPLAANGGGPVAAPPVSNGYGSMTVPPVGNVGGPVAAPLVGGHGGGVIRAPPVVGGPEAMWLVGLIGGTAMLITSDPNLGYNLRDGDGGGRIMWRGKWGLLVVEKVLESMEREVRSNDGEEWRRWLGGG